MLERRSNIVVLQWARLGDLFHSRPALRAVQRAFHPAHVTLCCDARYESVAQLFPEIDCVLPMNLPAMAAMLRNDTMLPELVSELHNMITQLGHVDTCVNLTNHRSAWWFASVLANGKVLGYGTDPVAAVGNREGTSIPQSEHIAAKWLSFVSHDVHLNAPRNLHYSRSKLGRTVSVICDAGSERRSLTRSVIESLTLAAASSGAVQVTLLGANADDAIDSVTCTVRDLRGKTDLNGLKEELASTSLVIGPDTGALHFAAALGKPVLGIYLDGANPAQTGVLSSEADYIVAGCVQEIEQCIGNSATNWIALHFEKEALFTEELPLTRSCPLSVIIPEFAQTHYADAVLRQLAECALPCGTEIIVVSSALDSIDWGQAKARRGVVRDVEAKARTFAQACNRGAMLARGEWLMFLNDDCEFSPAAFNHLWTGRKPSHIIGPKLHDWDSLLQSAGFVMTCNTVSDVAESCETSDTAVELDGLSAAVMLIESSVFDRLGGFDERFRNGYEDVDLCLRAKQRGIKFSLAESTFTHFRGSSPERHANDESNLDLLRSLWPARQAKIEKRSSSASLSNCPVLLLSDEPAYTAGPLIRWRSPLERIGLKENADFNWIRCTEGSEDRIQSALQHASAVIAFRSISYQPARELLRQWCQNERGRLIFDADDILIDRFASGSPRAEARQPYEQGVRDLMEMADITTAPNAQILGHHGCTRERSLIVPSAPLPEHFVNIADTPGHRAGFNVGFAASVAHGIDLGVAIPAIANLLDSDESARFYWWGAHPGEIAYHPQVRRGGRWQMDYMTHLRRIHAAPIDLWIVPLLESHANRARSPVKAFEYIGAGLPCLFSRVEPYQSYLADFSDLLVQNTVGAWQAAIEKWRRPDVRTQLLKQIVNARIRLSESAEDLNAYRNLPCVMETRQRFASRWFTLEAAG